MRGNICSFLVISVAVLQIVPLALADVERESLDRRAHRAALQSSSHEEDASVGPGDLLVVFGTTSTAHHPELVKATRFWRKVGQGSLLALSAKLSEAWHPFTILMMTNKLSLVY